MSDALAVFASVCNSRWFQKTSIVRSYLPHPPCLLTCIPQILFLNNTNTFAEKLPHSPLHDHFPDYDGGDDYDAACNYFLQRFVSLNKFSASKHIYPFYMDRNDAQQTKRSSRLPCHLPLRILTRAL
jgi:guanine nucleotide-binding protein G(i) subunit alpha